MKRNEAERIFFLPKREYVGNTGSPDQSHLMIFQHSADSCKADACAGMQVWAVREEIPTKVLLQYSAEIRTAIPAALPPVATLSQPKTAGPKNPPIFARVFHSARPPACAGRGKLPSRDAVRGAVALHEQSAAHSAANDATPLTMPPPLSAGDSMSTTPPIEKGTTVCSRLSLYLRAQGSTECCTAVHLQ